MPNQLRIDPTRTTMLRRQFIVEMNRRFIHLRRAIDKLVVEDDVFGLIQPKPLIFMQEKQAWRFRTNAAKIKAYRQWLQQQMDAEILTVDVVGKPWTSTYVESAYSKGMMRAYTDLHAEALAETEDFYRGSKAEFLRSSFGQPIIQSKVELLGIRAFTELEGVTKAMSQQMSRILTMGLIRGMGVMTIARQLKNNVSTINATRARAIARTEIIAAHAEGQLDAFVLLGVKEVGIMAEWSTAGDGKVCDECAALESVVMTVDAARGLIPRHVNCRCCWIPADRVRKEKGQLRGRKARVAIKRSIRAERVGGTFKQVKRKSVWVGKGLL